MLVQPTASATAVGYSKHQSTFPMPPLYPRANMADASNHTLPSNHNQAQSLDSMSRTLKPYSMLPNKHTLRKARGAASYSKHTCERCSHSQKDHLHSSGVPKRKSNNRRSFSSTDSTSSSADSVSDSNSDTSSYTSYSSSRHRQIRGRPTHEHRPTHIVRPRQVSLNPLSMYVPSKEQFIPKGAHIHPAVAPYVQSNSIYASSSPATYRQPSPSVYRQPSNTNQQTTPIVSSTSPTHSRPQSQQPSYQSLRVTADQQQSVRQIGALRAAPTSSSAPYAAASSPAGLQSPQANQESPGGTASVLPPPDLDQASPSHSFSGSPTRGFAPYHGSQVIPTTVIPPQTIVLDQSPALTYPSYQSPIGEHGGNPSEFDLSAKQGTDQYEYSAAARGVYPVGALGPMGEARGVGQSLGGTAGGESLYEESTQQISQAESAIFLPDFRGRSRGVKKARQGCCA